MEFREFTSQTWSGRRKRPRPMPLGLHHIMLPRLANPLPQRLVHRPRHPGRDAHHQRAGRHPRPFRDDRASGDDAARSDVRPVEEHAPHADQAVVLDRAAVENRAVPDADAGADARGQPRIYVHDRAVLQVGRLADHDRVHVATQHGAVPHAGARGERHVPEHHRARSDEGRRIDADYCLAGWNGHFTHASTGSPFFWAGFQRRVFAMSSASLLNVSRLEGSHTRASSVEPSLETWMRRMVWRGNTVASAGTGMRVAESGSGRVSKQRLSWLYAGPG